MLHTIYSHVLTAVGFFILGVLERLNGSAEAPPHPGQCGEPVKQWEENKVCEHGDRHQQLPEACQRGADVHV